MNRNTNPSLGFVIIGRNEGERLKQCIKSILVHTSNIIYVDSASSDDSLAFAHSEGIETINLDLSIPFSAARARNEGWRQLIKSYPEVEYIHFIDGDCYISDTWLDHAIAFMGENTDYAIICGQRKEIHPESSIYNALCDAEWNTPTGDTRACGGDFIIHRHAMEQIGGFRDDFIAGEEPEMCFRLRQRGFKIYRYDAIMTMHDANIFRFFQWWNRTKRCGYAFALGAYTHGMSPEKFKVRETLRAVFWGLFIPLALFLAVFFKIELVIIPLILYSIFIGKLLVKPAPKYLSAMSNSFFLLVGKFAEAQGVMHFIWNKTWSKENRIIEYK